MAFSTGGVAGMDSSIHVRPVWINWRFTTVDDEDAARLSWCFE